MEKPVRKIILDSVEDRRGGLGGSDSPVILGVSPFQTRRQLYLEKVGLAEPTGETPAMKRGKRMEGIIADLYQEIKERPVEVVKQKIVHPALPFIWAHIDRRITDPKRPNHGPGVLEIKCPGISIYNKCKREGLPLYYVVQLQHYLGVTGMKWGGFAVFSAEAWEMIEFDVQRDPELIKIIFRKGKEFWENTQKGIAPEDDSVQIELPDFNGDVANMNQINPMEWEEAVRAYQQGKMLKAEGDDMMDLAEVKIKAMMEAVNTEVAEGAGARIYWAYQKARKSLDKAAFKREHPEAYRLYESFLVEGEPPRVFRAFFPKPIISE
jgi:putative phage-type endonuclease